MRLPRRNDTPTSDKLASKQPASTASLCTHHIKWIWMELLTSACRSNHFRWNWTLSIKGPCLTVNLTSTFLLLYNSFQQLYLLIKRYMLIYNQLDLLWWIDIFNFDCWRVEKWKFNKWIFSTPNLSALHFVVLLTNKIWICLHEDYKQTRIDK